MVKIALETDECWELMSCVFNRLLDEIEFDKSDRAKMRRWKSSDMKAGSDELRALQEKMNEDLAKLWQSRLRRPIKRGDQR